MGQFETDPLPTSLRGIYWTMPRNRNRQLPRKDRASLSQNFGAEAEPRERDPYNSISMFLWAAALLLVIVIVRDPFVGLAPLILVLGGVLCAFIIRRLNSN